MKLYGHERSRGRGDKKRTWEVEMNEARRLYLSTYGIIDTLDKYMSTLNMHYTSWKYWHAAMLHYKKLVVIMSYDMYTRVAAGKAGDKYKMDKPLGFAAFRERLSAQMMAYDPSERKYAGDALFRKSTATPKRKRSSPAPVGLEAARKEAPEHRKLGHLGMLEKHWVSITKANNSAKCNVCSTVSKFRCVECGPGVAICAPWNTDHRPCFLRQHDAGFFGLGYGDTKAVGACPKKWKPPSKTSVKTQRAQVADQAADE